MKEDIKIKYCARCHLEKPVEEFTKIALVRNGYKTGYKIPYSSYCRPCASIKQREWHWNNENKIRLGVKLEFFTFLTRIQKETLYCLMEEGLTRQQTADKLGISLQSVNQIVLRIRARIPSSAESVFYRHKFLPNRSYKNNHKEL